MDKKLVIIILLLMSELGCLAQTRFRAPLKSQNQNMNLALSNYTIGLKGGCLWSVMPKSDLHKVTYDGYYGFDAGLVLERYFPKFSVAIEALFSNKGTSMYFDMTYQASLTQDSIFHRSFSLDFNVITVRIPVTYYFKGTFKEDKVVPYVFLGPQVDIPLRKNTVATTTTSYGGHVFSSNDTISQNINASAIAGLGLMARIPLDGYAFMVKFDVAANYGLRNLAYEGFVVDNKELSIRLHDFEANITMIFPIKKRLRDACYYLQ